jgi:hypothetical protein
MSFILDALKKSEEERLRQQNPSALPTAVPRSSCRTPAWVWALLGLLAVNLAALAVVLLKPPIEAETPKATTTPAVATSSTTTTPPAAAAASNAAPPVLVHSTPMPSVAAQSATSMPLSQSLVTVPTRDQQLAAGANLPPAALNLHVYDADPIKRFVLLNGERLREGDTSREGLDVISITPEGVVLSYGNASFAVSIEGR